MALGRQWSLFVLAHVAGRADIGIGHHGLSRSKYVNMSQGAAATIEVRIAESAH
jgi:hypothetical protein